MKKILLLTGLILFLSRLLLSQNNYPPVGISDNRVDIYGLKNARVVIDYNQTLPEADILVMDGKIADMSKDLKFPQGTVIIDLKGKTIYPSFIDPYTSYGMTEPAADNQNQMAMFMRGTQRSTGQTEEKPRVADYWNMNIRESYNALDEFKHDKKKADELRKAGFGIVVTFKNDGLARGTSVLTTLGEDKAQSTVILGKATVNYSLQRGRGDDMYPVSQFGSIALLRQFNYDGQWYTSLPHGYFYDASLQALLENRSLPKVFEAGSKYEILRADAIGDEFGQRIIVKGGGDEYQLLDEIKKSDVSLIIPLNFPSAPDVKDPYDAAAVSLSLLKHWEMAPANPLMVCDNGIEFAFTASGLSKIADYLANIRKAVKYGLDKKEALKAMTYTPAKMIRAGKYVGAIRKGMLANFIITSGDIFDKECIIYENWIQGRAYKFTDLDTPDLSGNYILSIDGEEYKMNISGKADKPSVTLSKDEANLKASMSFDKRMMLLAITTDEGQIRLSGLADKNKMKGDGKLADGRVITWKAKASDEDFSNKSSQPKAEMTQVAQEPDTSIGDIIYPFLAYGWKTKPVAEDILIRNATVWTNESEGILEATDVLVKDGKIAKIGRGIKEGKARVIDGTGMHLSAGIIDEHSHIANNSTNEMGQVITSEVRIGDVVNPADMSVYRQLSGGVTAAHILHGSANPIGGQSVILKHRWGASPEEMKIKGQVGFLKHALGENVKRTITRYPNTRMGVEHIIRDAYQRAVDYRKELGKYNSLSDKEKAEVIKPRKDLELDALVDVLEERSFITCHTYMQSEGNMIMKLAEDFGIKAHTLIHFNEGYKIADKMAEHGAAGSVFSDWWNYKYEVYEGIPYNAPTLLQQGVLTCLHSDNAELARRLNQEAGKIVKYGGIHQEEAIKLVTLNPAKILHLDHRMGSIKVGKDADMVLWSDNPLSIYARAKITMVDGIIYFDEEKDAEMKIRIEEERSRIIQKVLKEVAGPSTRIPGTIRRRTN